MADVEEATQTIQFHGRVLPMGHKINLNQPIENLVVTPNKQLPIDFRVTIEESIVLVACKHRGIFTEEIFNDAFIISNKVAHNVVDLMCFQYGLVLTVVLEEWTDADGNRMPVKTQNIELLGIVTSISNNSMEAPLRLLFDEPDVALVLHDLTRAMRNRDDVAINCARSIDGIKHLLSPNSKDEKKAWSNLAQTLNLDSSYTKFVTTLSSDPRHRKPSVISRDDISEILRRSWNVMNRYLEYRLQNTGPLAAPEFPLLTG
jgi:hypothetical protein